MHGLCGREIHISKQGQVARLKHLVVFVALERLTEHLYGLFSLTLRFQVRAQSQHDGRIHLDHLASTHTIHKLSSGAKRQVKLSGRAKQQISIARAGHQRRLKVLHKVDKGVLGFLLGLEDLRAKED